VLLEQCIGACTCVFSLRFPVWCLCYGLLSLKHIGPYSVKAVGSLIVAITSFEATGYVLNKTAGLHMEMLCVLDMKSDGIVKKHCVSDASC